ncbi:MAG TPA: class I SAM-dependent methyltransferase [Candidatus Acidoferrum sp.]|nr:class I SAM-dependent methyltransferase [Candidatus Acidoferrum sp.]
MDKPSDVEASQPALDDFYDVYPQIEEQFNTLLDVSLNPRGPEVLYELVDEAQLPSTSTVLDLGCGEGKQSLELAQRYGFEVVGVDPVDRHINLSSERLSKAAETDPGLRSRVRFTLGTAEKLPLDLETIDLIWCRDVFSHVAKLEAAFAECRRVLRQDGHMLLYQMFATEMLEAKDADRVFRPLKVVSADASATEEAINAAGLHIDRCIVLGTEWGEYAEEKASSGTRALIHAARLLRDPARYVGQFGKTNYDIKVADCLWHIDRMIGKLSGRIYVLSMAR